MPERPSVFCPRVSLLGICLFFLAGSSHHTKHTINTTLLNAHILAAKINHGLLGCSRQAAPSKRNEARCPLTRPTGTAEHPPRLPGNTTAAGSHHDVLDRLEHPKGPVTRPARGNRKDDCGSSEGLTYVLLTPSPLWHRCRTERRVSG